MNDSFQFLNISSEPNLPDPILRSVMCTFKSSDFLKERENTFYEIIIDFTSFLKYHSAIILQQLKSLFPKSKITLYINNTKPEYKGIKKLRIYEKCLEYNAKYLSLSKPIGHMLHKAQTLKQKYKDEIGKQRKIVLVSNSPFLISLFTQFLNPQELYIVMTKKDYKAPSMQEIFKEIFKDREYPIFTLDLLPKQLAYLKAFFGLSNKEAKEAKNLVLKASLEQQLLHMLPASIMKIKSQIERYEKYKNRSTVALVSFIWRNHLYLDTKNLVVYKSKSDYKRNIAFGDEFNEESNDEPQKEIVELTSTT